MSEILSQIRKINEEESKQLSLDFQQNVQQYLQEISKKNEKEIQEIVNKFIRAYLKIERNRLNYLGKPIDLPKMEYSASNLLSEEIQGVKVYKGYNGRIPNLNARSSEKANQRTNHFVCMARDSYLKVKINSNYWIEVQLTLSEFGL